MGILVKYNCIECDTYVERFNSSGKYCSIKCQSTHQSKNRLTDWLERNVKVGKTIVRRYLVERDGYKCSVCDIENWLDKPINLEIDHTDGNAYNNVPMNLRLICPNCHAQTATYKNRNKGNGRKLRQSDGWLLQ